MWKIVKSRKLLYGLMREISLEMGVKGNSKIKFQNFFDYLTNKCIELGHLPEDIKINEDLLYVYDALYHKASTFWENVLERLY